MTGPIFLRADPSWANHLWLPDVWPRTLKLAEDPTAAPSTETLLCALADGWPSLPVRTRAAIFVRAYLQVLLTAASAGIILMLSTSAALVVHFCMVWMGVAALMRMGDPPLVMVMLLHLPALRVSSWLGATLARALMDGVSDRNACWRALVLGEVQHRMSLSSHGRQCVGGRSSSLCFPIHPGRAEPRLF